MADKVADRVKVVNQSDSGNINAVEVGPISFKQRSE